MTKTKTATLEVCGPWRGNGLVCSIFYRGIWQFNLNGETRSDLVNRAKTWCRAQGYTHVKLHGLRIALEPLQTAAKEPA